MKNRHFDIMNLFSSKSVYKSSKKLPVNDGQEQLRAGIAPSFRKMD